MSKGDDLITTMLGGALAIGVLDTVDKKLHKKIKKAKKLKARKIKSKARSKNKGKTKKSNDPFKEWIGG